MTSCQSTTDTLVGVRRNACGLGVSRRQSPQDVAHPPCDRRGPGGPGQDAGGLGAEKSPVAGGRRVFKKRDVPYFTWSFCKHGVNGS